MVKSIEAKELFGAELDETPDTLAFGLSGEFAGQIMDELDRQGLTLSELAKRMGIRQPTLCGMLRGASNMTLKTMARMALALGCSVEAPKLVQGGGAMSSSSSTRVVPFDSLASDARGAEFEALQA